MDFSKKNPIGLLHLPTAFIMIGYLSYWAELYFIKSGKGKTSLLALAVFTIYAAANLFLQRDFIKDSLTALRKIFIHFSDIKKFIFVLAVSIILFICAVNCIALSLPPHLCQEIDSINYHITIPRQHLILNSFSHIRWSAADLRLLPLEFSLAPYWLISELPNKFSQIFFIFGLLITACGIAYRLNKNNPYSFFLISCAFFGSSLYGIQMGILMLDLVICYLFIASVDSFLNRRIVLGSVEFAFFFWSKPFMPFHAAAIFLGLAFFIYLLKKAGIKKTYLGFEDDWNPVHFSGQEIKKTVFYVSICSFFIAGPFLTKSLYYTGTPLYPFYPGIIDMPRIKIDSAHWESILSVSHRTLSIKDSYGSGRTPLDFLRHFWFLAVPERGVVNRYDYPLGLPYLLFLAPFLYLTINSLRSKKCPLLPLFAIFYWFTWWFGSQQARFLYIPLMLIFIVVSAKFNRPPLIFLLCLLLSLVVNSISIYRTHRNDFGKPRLEVLRPEDRALLLLNKKYAKESLDKPITSNRYDVAYADFPVNVINAENRDAEYWVFK